MKKKTGSLLKRGMSAVLALVLAGGMTACGGSTSSVSGSAAAQESEASSIETGDDIMNIAFTDTVGTLNPLNMN